jgi:hypothetical protein
MTAGRALLGLFLVTVGTVLLLDAAGVMASGEALRTWWPAGLVLLGAVQIGLERRVSMVSALVVGSGLVALAVTTEVVDADLWALVWPILLIGAGAWLVIRRRLPPVSRDNSVSRLAVLAPARLSSRAAAFERADVTAVFTTMQLDLTRASLAEGGARIAATSVFGSVVVVVPKGWRILVRGFPIFGGWDDTTSRIDVAPGAPELHIQVLTLFGGFTVRHPQRWK